MKLGSNRQLRNCILEDDRAGFEFYVVAGQYRGRRFVSEVSGVKKDAHAIVGFSWMCCELRQPQMRRIERVLRDTLGKKVKDYA